MLLVRHGRATGGWDTDIDPGLDDLGRSQAEAMATAVVERVAPGNMALLTSPLRRTQETAAPLAKAWGVVPVIDVAVAEVPSPPGIAMTDRVAWLRTAMAGTWTDLGDTYTTFRDGVVARVTACTEPTIFVSHFIAINAVIGVCLGDDRLVIASLDNCSITEVLVADDGSLQLVQHGHEADTLIR